MNNRRSRTALTRAFNGVAVAALFAAPAAAADIRGRVVEKDKGVALPGATVTVQGTNLSATAGRDGSFAINGAPDGPQTLVVDYIGYGEALQPVTGSDQPVEIALSSSVDGNEVVVTGTRLAERRALQTKKAADNLVEALYANDVGKLPDQNVAEAIRRLPGLSVANDQGEGRYVIIRGVNPNLVNVLLNGQTLPAPEPDGRQVKLDDIPSAMISAVIVTKSLTPDQDANAIGGEVNIRTLSAFDRNKSFFADARGAYGRYALNHKNPWEADGQIGGIFADGKLGAVLSFNYSRRPIESENFQGSTNFLANGGPDQFGLRDYNLVRTRLGAVANFDFRPSDAVKLFIRSSYSRFVDNERRDQNRVDQIVYNDAAGTYSGRGSILIRRREEKDNTKSGELGGEFDLGAAGQLALAGTYTRAIKNDPLRSEYNFRAGSNSVSGTFDLDQSPYGFAFSAPFDPSKFPLNSVNYDRRHAQEDLWQLRGDYTLPVAIGEGSTFKVGAKYLNRHKTNDRDYLQYGRGTTFNASSATYNDNPNFYDGRYTFGPRIDYDAAQAYAAANPGALIQSTSNINSSRNNSQVNDYDVREKISSAYAMATLTFGKLTIVPGLRVEHTQDSQKAKLLATGATAPVDQDFNSFNSQSYTDWFPGVNAHFNVTRDFVLRGAVTTAIGRPNYPDLAPYVSVDTTSSPTTITLGNPSLQRYKAVNLDAAAEYYLPSQGLLSVGLFYKHIDNPIYTQSLLGQSGNFGGQDFTNVSVTRAINAGSAVVKGIEVNAQVQFTFLPGFLNGFGASANYSRISGHASDLPGRIGRVPLFLQSKNVGTLQLFYEKYGFAARVAYSFRSSYVDTLGTTAATDQYTGYNGQLDVHASYQISKQLTVFADGTNLNDAAWRRYMGVKSQLVERERYDYSIRGGIQLHF
ncbi:TonB-dependent receptor [Sphingomonas sp.]|uniref:TonB-dependent receptor n=1 Tax=Sphingomonas sp. TaxID=28214 RepID=UPI003B3A8CA0